MLVKIKQKHFRLATSYISFSCPLYFALKDVFKKEHISVGGFDAWIDGKKYEIQKDWGDEISAQEINQNIKLAKQKKKAKSYVIEIS